MAKTFKEKKKKVTAVQWTGENIDELKDFYPDGNVTKTGRSVMITTKQSASLLNEKDYLVQDGNNFSSMNEKDFNDKYKEQTEE